MDPTSQQILRCPRCNKPFDKESTLKRHNYYCRSRKAPVSRVHSCIACAKRKSRCNGQKPACSRCLDRGIPCEYRPPKRPAETTPNLGHDSAAAAGNTPESVHTGSSGGGSTPLGSDSTDNTVPPEWDAAELGFLHDFSDPQAYETLDLSTPPPLSGVDDFSFPFDRSNAAQNASTSLVQTGRKSPLPTTISLPFLISQPTYIFRSLEQRPATQHLGRQKPASLVLKTLKSYVLMMTSPHDRATPPPFLHPKLMSLVLAPETADENAMAQMEPLHNCISLLHMVKSRVPGSRKLFWRNVRDECERLHAKVAKMTKWETLYALQALFLYIILRLDEGRTENNRQVDLLLVAGVTALSTHLASLAATEPTTPTSWNDWIFEESRRRLCVVYPIINMLVFFEPVAMCDLHTTDLLIAPLPARRPLWEAVEESSWRAERSHVSSSSTGEDGDIFALSGSGEIVRLKHARLPCHDAEVAALVRKPGGLFRSVASWDEWMVGMDGLGGLVMLAASLTG